MNTDRFKFRAWNKDKRVMVYDNEDDSKDYWDGVCSSNLGLLNALLEREVYEFMQSTGLKDKNGVLIYEGDIVEKFITTENSTIRKLYEVVFDYDGFCLKNGETYAFGFSKDGKLIKEKVIGNIYNKPE